MTKSRGSSQLLRSIALVGSVVVIAGCHRRTPQVDGEWRSNEALTQASLRRIEVQLTPGQRKRWLSPGFFGELYFSFHDGRVIASYEGKCDAAEPFTVAVLPTGEAEVHTRDAKTGEDQTMLLKDGMLQARLGNGKLPQLDPFRELFTRVTRQEAEAANPCLHAGPSRQD